MLPFQCVSFTLLTGTVNMTDPELNSEGGAIIQQNLSLFSPASYNLPHFKYKHLPQSEIRNAWGSWIRWFETIMAASGVTDGPSRKMQLLAMGGLELQSAFYGIPGCDDEDDDITKDPYISAKEKLTEYFSPKHHDSFERFLFWSMVPGDDEPIEKFALRVQQKAEKCSFGKTETESRHIAIVDKIIQYTSDDLRQKLLEKERLTLDEAIKVINAYESVRYQSAKMNSKSIRGTFNRPYEPERSTVNRLYENSSRPPSTNPSTNQRCTRCGYRRHRTLEDCPAWNKPCLRCRNVGHFKSVCNTKMVNAVSIVFLLCFVDIMQLLLSKIK